MIVVAERIATIERDAVVAHFLALPATDWRLRFGGSPSPESARAYVEGIDFQRDALFAVRDNHLALIGVAHVAFGIDVAEVGLSVLPAGRGRGIGSALFERAATHARNRSRSRLIMHCLRENAPIMRIARRFGMVIVNAGGDADACLDLPRVTATSIGVEFVADRLALYDRALKAQAAAWNCIVTALLGAAPAPAPGAGSTEAA